MKSPKFRLWSGAVLLCLPLACGAAQPVSPNEIQAGIYLSKIPLMLSPDGKWVGLSTSKGTVFADLENGKAVSVDLSLVSYLFGFSAWSPVDRTLVFPALREGKMILSAMKPESDAVRDLLVIPRRLGAYKAPVWSVDGKTLYFLISQELPYFKSDPADDNPPFVSPNVTLEYTEPYLQQKKRESFQKEYPEAYAEGNRSLVMALDVASGKTGLVARGNDIHRLILSPDGRHLLALQFKNRVPKKEVSWTKRYLADVYLIDVPALTQLPSVDLEHMEDRKAGWFDSAGRRLMPALKDVHLSLSLEELVIAWSPDASRFAYAEVGRGTTGDVFVYEVASKQLHNLTEQVVLSDPGKSLGYGENYTSADDSLKFGHERAPLWTPDGKALLAVGRGELWSIPVDEKQAAKKLSGDLPREVRWVVPTALENIAATDNKGSVLLVAKDRLTRLDSFWTVSPGSGKIEKRAEAGIWINSIPRVDTKSSVLVYSGQTDRSKANAYQLAISSDAAPQPITRYKLELAERIFPESRVLQWRTAGGSVGYGLLYLPAEASKTHPVPLLLDGYPGQRESRLDVRAAAGADFYKNDLHTLLHLGFAVLYADLPMSDEGVYEQPLKQVTDGVMAATDAALATGVIDEKRLGIMGSSYGGFMVQGVIARTDRFKAAVSIAGLSDWFGDYVGGGGELGPLYHEVGQGRFGKPLWEDPQRYVENSPLVYWNGVHTPLLLVHGEGDSRVSIRHSEESFRGLQRLERTAIFARYRRMTHELTPEADKRIQGWFREHLLGAKAITQLADQGSFIFSGSDEDDGVDPAPPPSP